MNDHQLNPAQREAVDTLSGPLLVLAGAGTGKTRVVTYRVARLIKHRVATDRILAVTFTNRAAKEMQSRILALLGGGRRRARPHISTFHSLCVRILRRQIAALGYPTNFAIMDRSDQEAVARDALREVRAPEASLRPSDLIREIGRWKTAGLRPRQAEMAADSDLQHLAAVAYRRYQQQVKTRGAVDFDDLLLLTEEVFEKYPAVRRAEAERFDHVLVDEYQDTNGSQYRIIKSLAAGHRNLCVVGDDDQSIYAWRGAEVAHILRFQQDWPDAKVVRLEENYRSTSAILDHANQLIVFNKQRHAKVLRSSRNGGEPPRILQFNDEAAEAEGVVADLRTRLTVRGSEPRDFAILFRTNEQPRAFETELRKAKLPYVLIGGMSFYDRREIRDVLAYLKIVANQRDDAALRRIINTPPRGIGPAVVKRLVGEAVSRGMPLWDVLKTANGRTDVSQAARSGIGRFCETVTRFHKRIGRVELGQFVRELIEEVGYLQALDSLYPDPTERAARRASLEEIVNAAANYDKGSKRQPLVGFLDEAALGDRDDSTEKDAQLARNAIALMTMHSAKGLEFSQVYLVGMEEGILPHHRSVADDGSAVDEERRLCYVGVTRAMDRLTLSLSLTRKKWGKVHPSQPSRFLYEMTGQAERFEARKHRSSTAKPKGQASGRKRSSSVRRASRPRR